MNSVNLIGRIGKEIELKFLPSGNAVASFTIALDQSYKDQQGQKVDKTSWIDIVSFKGAETINQYFKKGDRIGIVGELEQQTWKDQQGNNRSKVVVKLNSFDFIEKKDSGYSQPNQQPKQQRQQPKVEVMEEPYIDIDEDNIPF